MSLLHLRELKNELIRHVVELEVILSVLREFAIHQVRRHSSHSVNECRCIPFFTEFTYVYVESAVLIEHVSYGTIYLLAILYVFSYLTHALCVVVLLLYYCSVVSSSSPEEGRCAM